MAHRVAWSPRAIEYLKAISQYISADSSAYAAIVVKTILTTTRNLSRFRFAVFDYGLRWLDELEQIVASSFKYDLVNLSSHKPKFAFQQPARGHADRRTYQGSPGASEKFCLGGCEV